MLRTKSRSGSIDLGHKNHSSIFSRSKLCRGDDVRASQVDLNALKPQSRNNKDKDRSMQGQKEQLVEELNRTKEDLVVAVGEKEKSLNEIKKMKQEKKVAEIKTSEVNELSSKVRSLEEMLSSLKDESKQKDVKIRSLVMELGSVKKLETELAARDSLIDRLRRESESRVTDLSADNKNRIMELEAELEKAKTSERKMLESLQQQTKQLEVTKIELEEAKLESVSLHKKVDGRNVHESRSKENIVQSAKEIGSRDHQLAQALESERVATMKIKSLQHELGLVKNELKQAIDAEETNKKAMDELAIALKEVTTESNQVKEKHKSTLLELEHVKEESEQLKEMVRKADGRYQKRLAEAEKETELHRNTANRLRLEAEESLLAWNGKEMGFVNCIKTAEEEKVVVQHEKEKLIEVLKATEMLTRTARDENLKLRDILKQAINESNAAKAAAGIARDENSLLKDSLSEKDEALLVIHKENERLRLNNLAAKENLKEYKKLLSSSSMEVKIDNKETNEKSNSQNSYDVYQEVEEANGEKRSSNFEMDDIEVIDDQDPEKAEALKHSIFYSDYYPKSEPPLPIKAGAMNSGDHDSVNSNDLFDSDSDRIAFTRKKALFRRFSDIMMRKKVTV